MSGCATDACPDAVGQPTTAANLPVLDVAGTPKFSTAGGATPTTGARTIPNFTFSQRDSTNGATYAVTMVGAAPERNTATTIPSQVIPLVLNFANGGRLDGGRRAGAVVASPIFDNYAYSAQMAGGDIGQYGDVFMRAQFNRIGTGYHVRFGAPTTTASVTLNVPQNQGTAYVNSRGVVYGLVDIVWFSSQLQNLMNARHVDPTTVPVFLTDNVMLYEGNDPSQCCVIGYHGASHPTGSGAWLDQLQRQRRREHLHLRGVLRARHLPHGRDSRHPRAEPRGGRVA